MLRISIQSIRALIVFTVITGVAYPLLVTGIAQVAFKRQANGSLIEKDGKVVGSALIGQPFSGPKYFAIIPAAFASTYPQLGVLNVMRLATPQSAILSAVIFNALVIIALIPLALRGVSYTPSSASKLLSRNLYIYGLGGIVAPFIGIKLIDLVIQLLPGM